MKKLSPKYAGTLFSFYASAMMVFIITCVLVTINGGLNDEWCFRVLRSYIITWPIAFISLLIVRPVVVKLVNYSISKE